MALDERGVAGAYRHGMAVHHRHRPRFWHPFADMGAVSQHELVIERGEGVWVFDDDGPPLPRRHRVALVRQPRPRPRRRSPTPSPRRCTSSRPTTRSATSATARRTSWRERLAALAPMADAQVFLTTGGGDSIDAAAKLARRHFVKQGQPERVHLISPHPGLPRHARLRHLARRHRGQRRPTGARCPADLHRPVRLAARARAGDPPRRPGPRRGVLLRAGDRRRRRLPPPEGYIQGVADLCAEHGDPARHRLA